MTQRGIRMWGGLFTRPEKKSYNPGIVHNAHTF